ncbi:MAG: glycosyltransferase family 4 protein [Patescibacteria group bacterium]
MKIFFITSKLKNQDTASGSVIEIDYMMRELVSLGNDVTAVTVYSRDNDLTEKTPYGVLYEHVTTPRLIPAQLAVYRILKKYEKDADIFHIDAQYMYGGGLYRLLGGIRPLFAYLIRPPLIKDEYVSYFFQKRYQKKSWSLGGTFLALKKSIRYFIERFIFTPILANHVDYVSCLNPLLLKEHRQFGLKKANYGLIIGDTYPMDAVMRKTGITTEHYQEHAGTNEKVVLYCSGRMAPGKGYDLLLEAFARVEHKDRFKVILGGTGPEEGMVRQAIADLGLQKNVELTGWVSREKMFEYLKMTDIYVFARWGTTLSALTLMETMTFGIPLIVPRGTGLSWTAGKSALTFEPENPDDLARQIERLGADVELRRELSRQCYERLKEADIDPHQTVVAINVIMKSLVFSPRDKYPLKRFLQGYGHSGK